MRVTFDDQVFTGQRIGGISRYFAELLREFTADPGHEVEALTPFRWVANEHLLDAVPGRFAQLPAPAPVRRGKIMRAANTLRPASLRPAGLLHHTHYLPGYLRRPARTRVCTVYDMIPEVLPELYPGGSPHFAKERYVRACDGVLCISETTRADLLRCYGPQDKPILVTPLAVGRQYYDARPAPQPDPYVLFVGRREQYKNFDVVLRAVSALAEKLPALRLVCTGGGPLRPAERERIAELRVDGRVEQRNVDEPSLPGLYAAAVALVFPSRYEGFGLPIIEAFAAGCPVIVAATPCSLEVSDGAAQIFEPDDDGTLAALLARLAEDAAERDRWTRAGRAKAGDFSWHRTARLTAAAYREIAAA